MSDIAGWLAGASRSPAEAMPSRYRGCNYPGCASVVLRGSQEIASWRHLTDATATGGRRVLLCPQHAAAWDEYVAAQYDHDDGEPNGPVLRH